MKIPNLSGVKNAITRTVGMTGLRIRKASPEILIAIGVGGIIVAAGTPTEKVYPTIVGLADILVGIAGIVVLVFSEAPCALLYATIGAIVRALGGIVLQVACRKRHRFAFRYGEYADTSCGRGSRVRLG